MAASITIRPNVPGSPDSVSMGALGADLISNTVELTGDWAIITAITNTVIATAICSTISVNGAAVPSTLAAFTLDSGKSLYGRFSAVTLTSGILICYRAQAY